MITSMSQADKEMAELFRQAWEVDTGSAAWEDVDEWAAYNPLLTAGAVFPNFNNRIVLDKSMFQAATTKLRLSFDGPIDASAASATSFMAVVGLAASGGNPWDFASAPIPVLFSTVDNIELEGVLTGTDANRYVSDEIDLVIDGTADVVVSMIYATGSTGSSTGTTGIPANTWHMYLNAAGGGISDLAPAGLVDVRLAFGDNQQWALSKIEAYVDTVVPGLKCDWPNMKTEEHMEDETWARWALDYVGGRQATMAKTGSRKFQKQGLIYITVYTPLGGGLAQARDAAQVALFAYEGQRTPGDVWFRNVRIDSEGHGQGTGRDKSWWTTLVVAEFIYEHLR